MARAARRDVPSQPAGCADQSACTLNETDVAEALAVTGRHKDDRWSPTRAGSQLVERRVGKRCEVLGEVRVQLRPGRQAAPAHPGHHVCTAGARAQNETEEDQA